MTRNEAVTAAMPIASPPSSEASWIQKTPDVCGGDACIRNTRIRVWGLVNCRRLGMSDAELLSSILGLTQADLDTAWKYYEEQREEIDRTIKEDLEA